MKYCTHCGAQLLDEAIICPNCGCSVETAAAKKESNGLKTAAKIFMLITCIYYFIVCIIVLCLATTIDNVWIIFLIPIYFALPMTIYYWKAVSDKRPVSTAFKVCTLIFVNLIAGILMLCDKD